MVVAIWWGDPAGFWERAAPEHRPRLQKAIYPNGLGFDGKGCIHPRQIAVVHDAFRPSESDLERAKAIVQAFREAEARGLGVVSLGRKMIDPPVVKRALKTVDLAVSLGVLDSDWN